MISRSPFRYWGIGYTAGRGKGKARQRKMEAHQKRDTARRGRENGA